MGNIGPFHCTCGLHEGQDKLVLFTAPWALDECGVEHLLPAMEALNIRAPRQTLGNFLPILTVELFDSFRELFVLFRRPMALIRSVLVLSRACLVDIGVFTLTPTDLRLNLAIVLFTQGRRKSAKEIKIETKRVRRLVLH